MLNCGLSQTRETYRPGDRLRLQGGLDAAALNHERTGRPHRRHRRSWDRRGQALAQEICAGDKIRNQAFIPKFNLKVTPQQGHWAHTGDFRIRGTLPGSVLKSCVQRSHTRDPPEDLSSGAGGPLHLIPMLQPQQDGTYRLRHRCGGRESED